MNTESLMKRAIALAEQGRRMTHPNPMVGALVVKGNRIIGEGWHREFGGPHAEVFALRAAGKRARGATLIVTLEPCSTFGKTPPCTDVILKSGIAKVVIGAVDPNPSHRGNGMRILRKHGIRVESGVLEKLVARQNEQFFTAMIGNRPFVAVKLAMSLDGKIATRTGQSQWISSEESRRCVHELRAHYDAVLVGASTCRQDNPRLNVRGLKGKWHEPFKVIVDPSLTLSRTARVITNNDPARVIVLAGLTVPERAIAAAQKAGINVRQLICYDGRFRTVDILAELRTFGISSVLVEGGGEMIGSFMDARVVDKVFFFYAPFVLGGRNAVVAVGGNGAAKVADAIRFSDMVWQRVGDDMLAVGYCKR